MNLYNEIDLKTAAWLEELVKQGVLAPGIVDTRDIRDIRPDELERFTQCHFFAGIGGWPYALDLAGWPRDRRVWTGSCPCQPFSAAGKGAGFDDERHLWPSFDWLIDRCRPENLFGEQVSSPAGLLWCDLIQADLEGKNYTFWTADACAAGVGALHIRQRLWWMAYANGARQQGRSVETIFGTGWRDEGNEARRGSGLLAGALGDTRSSRCDASSTGDSRSKNRSRSEYGVDFARSGSIGAHHWTGAAPVDWRDCDWLSCRDGKWRPVEPGTFPLAHGIPGRMGLLRGYGNAIIPIEAAEFVGTYLDAEATTA